VGTDRQFDEWLYVESPTRCQVVYEIERSLSIRPCRDRASLAEDLVHSYRHIDSDGITDVLRFGHPADARHDGAYDNSNSRQFYRRYWKLLDAACNALHNQIANLKAGYELGNGVFLGLVQEFFV
jgi:hypothetical protein